MESKLSYDVEKVNIGYPLFQTRKELFHRRDVNEKLLNQKRKAFV